jgi:hypothetical protein
MSLFGGSGFCYAFGNLTTPDIGIYRIDGVNKAMLFQRYRGVKSVDFAGKGKRPGQA